MRFDLARCFGFSVRRASALRSTPRAGRWPVRIRWLQLAVAWPFEAMCLCVAWAFQPMCLSVAWAFQPMSLCALAAALLPGVASAQAPHPIPEAHRWATITHAGNEPYVFTNPYDGQTYEFGGVDHEYQISRTEVTASEWIEFVRAYAPHLGGFQALVRDFTSRWILWNPEIQDYAVISGDENRPIETTWRYAAIYANWLHNDKALTADAFTSGAYDTATFITNPDHTFQDQLTRSPGARYWIPSADELIKAFHYDPNRHGPGEPGYWIYPHGSDNPPIPGAPGVGQTNTGYSLEVDVASYRDVQSPWGLWDAAGGVSEWTEGARYRDGFDYPNARFYDGSSIWDIGDDLKSTTGADRIEVFRYTYTRVGLRLAREIPSPASGISILIGIPLFATRRRSEHGTFQSTRGLYSRPRARICRLERECWPDCPADKPRSSAAVDARTRRDEHMETHRAGLWAAGGIDSSPCR